jgi:hypothetical protein
VFVVAAAAAGATALPLAPSVAAERAPGTGAPPAGSGINTAVAFANPDCVADAGPYGRMGLVTVDIGPVCLPPWKGGDNGGSTYQGVTEDTIRVVALVPNEQQATELVQRPVNYATPGTPGTVQDALSDALAGYEHAFGGTYTYGRAIELEFVVSSGDDEVAQRADALVVKARKPFAVLDHGARNLPVFDTEMVAAKIQTARIEGGVGRQRASGHPQSGVADRRRGPRASRCGVRRDRSFHLDLGV